MPNLFAYLVFFGYPLVVVALFRRLSLPAALAWSIVGGYLFLPLRVDFNLPMLPNLDKRLLPGLAAAIMAAVAVASQNARQRIGGPAPAYGVQDGWLPKSHLIRALLVVMFVGAFMTARLNGDSLTYGTRNLPGLALYDAFANILSTLVMLLPFFLARKYLADPRSHVIVLGVLCLAGLLYSLPTLYEIRMSPQLNKIVYGFFPNSWRQHIRGDGFRPLVFLVHGLQLGIFLTVAILATLGRGRLSEPLHKLAFLGASLWLLATLVLSKNLGALLITVPLIPVALFLGPRSQLRVAAVIAMTILIFPTLRGAGLIPVDKVVQVVSTINEQRASSLEFRLENEDRLLDKASQRPVFGWGGWGRSRVYTEKGTSLSTTDGYWIIILGEGGWTRYVAEFGLLTLPLLLLTFRRRYRDSGMATSLLCVVLAANLVDLIPNTGLTGISWLVAGALAGRLEVSGVVTDTVAEDPAATARQRLPYRRAHNARPAAEPAAPRKAGGYSRPRQPQASNSYTRKT